MKRKKLLQRITVLTLTAALTAAPVGVYATEPSEVQSKEQLQSTADAELESVTGGLTPDADGFAINKKGKLVGYRGSKTNITIPETVTGVEYNTFAGNTSLKSVTIPETVKRISSNAFRGCTSLSLVNIPSGMTYIARDAFWECPVVKFNVAKKNKKYASEYNCLYTKDKKTLLQAAGGKTMKFSSKIEKIESSAFYGHTGLKSIRIPDSVKTIGQGAFFECTGLKSIHLPNRVKMIEKEPFYGCTALKSICIPNRVKTIEERAFDGCASIKFDVAKGNTKYASQYNCLYTKDKKTLLAASGTKTIKFSKKITTISDNAFAGRSALTSVDIPNSVKRVGNSAFYRCTALKSVKLSKGLTQIPEDMFHSCSALTSVHIPKYIKYIGYGAFQKCTSLKELSIGSGVEEIGTCSVGHDPDLHMYENVATIFRDCASLKFKVAGGKKKYASQNGCLYSKDKKTLLRATNEESVRIAAGTTGIDDYAFEGCTKLTSVAIPESVRTIGEAFCDCKMLASIQLPKGLTSISDYAFMNCTALKCIYIPGGVKVSDILKDCTALEEIHFWEGTQTIHAEIWKYSKNLKAVYIPESVTEISGWKYAKGRTFTVYGKKGSAAEIFATENQLPFVDISGASQTQDQSAEQA